MAEKLTLSWSHPQALDLHGRKKSQGARRLFEICRLRLSWISARVILAWPDGSLFSESLHGKFDCHGERPSIERGTIVYSKAIGGKRTETLEFLLATRGTHIRRTD